MSTPRRPGPGDRPRRPRVAGTRKRTAPSRPRVHGTDNGTASATKPVDSTFSAGGNENDGPEPTALVPGYDDGAVDEREVVAARPVIDDTVVDELTADSVDHASPVADEEPEPAPEESAKEEEPEPGQEEPSAEPVRVVGPGGRKRLVVASVLLALTAVCGALAFWFFAEANALRNEGPAANHALSDPAATSEVNGNITSAVEQTFSYDFADTAKTENAAKNLLVGQAIQQYNDLYAIVKQLAPQQKLVLTTKVQASAVTLLQGDRAQVLLVVNQNETRTDTGQNTSDMAQISVGAVKQGNQWKIEQITQL